MKLTLALLLALSSAAYADTITNLSPDVNLRGCNYAAAQSVAGQCATSADGSCQMAGDPPAPVAKPVPTCRAYIKSVIEAAAEGWAKAADDAAIAAAAADPTRRQRLLTEASR